MKLDKILDEALSEYVLAVVDPIAADGVATRTAIRDKAKAQIVKAQEKALKEAYDKGWKDALEEGITL